MTSRERVTMALEHKQPDRIPVDLRGTFLTGIDEIVQHRLIEALGLKGQPDPRYPDCDSRIMDFFETDIRGIKPATSTKKPIISSAVPTSTTASLNWDAT